MSRSPPSSIHGGPTVSESRSLPTLTLPPVAVTRAGDGRVTVDLGVGPRVRPGQVATLAIGSQEAVADAVLAPADQLRFRFDNAPPLAAGSQPSRLRIDGVDSWLIDRTQDTSGVRRKPGNHGAAMSARHDRRVEENRSRLFDEIARLARTLSGESDIGPGVPAAAEEPTYPLDVLVERLGLSAFERRLLTMVVGYELDRSLASVLVETPTAALALARLGDGHWTAFSPESPLQRWGLLTQPRGDSFLHAPLVVDPSLVAWLLGSVDTCSAVTLWAGALRTRSQLPAGYRNCVEELVARLRAGLPNPAFSLAGGDRAGRTAIAQQAIEAVGMTPWLVEGAAIPDDPRRAASVDVAVGARAAPVQRPAGGGSGRRLRGRRGGFRRRLWRALVRRRDDRGDAPRHGARRSPGRRARESRGPLGRGACPAGGGSGGRAPGVPVRPQPRRSPACGARSTRRRGRWIVDEGMVQARARARRDLGDFVRRVTTAATLEDLVLPDAQRRTLQAVAAQVAQPATVYGRWKMAGASSRGLGITALFSGSSGTGKTTAGEALASQLGLDLLMVDLSQVVSKYIGETNKNLDRVFASAEAGGAVLLFDEADALFGKRSEVRDSHDRYANMEVSYLLQRMEAYRGLAILTTNQKSGLDEAFLRRLRFIVHFPFPDREMREALWRRAIPAELLDGAPDWRELARLSLAGGSIRNIALNAAFLAAEEGEAIAPRHLHQAVAAEQAKMEAAPTMGARERRGS